jgi:asparagine synthetase B (glutamine-hydrolysing)
VFLVQGSPDLKAAKEVADYLGTHHQEFYFTVQVSMYPFFSQLISGYMELKP